MLSPRREPDSTGTHKSRGRSCLETWQGTARGQRLDRGERAYVVEVIGRWIDRELATSIGGRDPGSSTSRRSWRWRGVPSLPRRVEHLEPLAVVADHLQLSNRDVAPATPRRVPSSPEPASLATAPDFLDPVEQHRARLTPLHLWLVSHVQADQGRPRSRG